MGEGIDRLMTAIQDAYAVWNKRVPTATLNRWFEQAVDANPPPAVSGRRLKLNYITQAKARPPSFVLFCSRADAVPQSYLRYLTNSHARGLRPAGHADPDHAARKGQSVRAQAQAAVMSEAASAQSADDAAGPRGAAAFIFVTILLDMLALGLILPILPKLVESFVDNDTATRGADLRPVRHRLGADAVLLLADPRRAVGPVRPAAGGAAVEFRAGARLCADGAGAVADLAVRRPGDLRHHLGEHLDGVCLYRRRDAAGTARRGVRQDRRRLRRRLHSRSRHRRPARRHGSAPAVLDRGGPELCEYALRLADPARVAAAGAPRTVPLEKRQPARRAASVALQPDSRRAVAGEFLRAGRACRAAVHLRALRDLPLWLGHDDGRAHAGAGRRLRDGGAGRGRRADRQALSANAAHCCSGLPAARSDFSSTARRRPGRCSGSAFP